MPWHMSSPARVQAGLAAQGADAAEAIFSRLPAETFCSDQTICWEGDRSTRIFQLAQGALRFCRVLPDGRRIIASFGLPGEIFGLSHMERYLFSAEAIGRCRVRCLPVGRLAYLFGDNPADHARILEAMRRQLSELQSQLLLMLHKSADERVAHFLLTMATRLTSHSCGLCDFRLPMARSDIADHLGLTVETVCRCIARLKRDGVIVLNGPHHVVIRDAAALQLRSGSGRSEWTDPAQIRHPQPSTQLN